MPNNLEKSTNNKTIIENDFDLQDPAYLTASLQRIYKLSDIKECEKLVGDIGRISGVRGIVISSRIGQVLYSKSFDDTTSLASTTAASLMLLKNLNLLSLRWEQNNICIKAFKNRALIVVSDSTINIGRLLTELEVIQDNSD